ncbi:MAG: PKD domain-containing protein [Bacteroidota bacterium]
MKKQVCLYACLCLSFFTSLENYAQTSAGTEFWIAYMENLTLDFNDQPVFSIHIAAETATTGTIEVPATGFTLPFSVGANELIEVNLPAAIWYSETSEVIENKGVRVTAERPIQVSTTHFRLFFTEATGVLPLTELSDEYLVTCFYEGVGSRSPSSFVVVATEDDTEIMITPNAFTNGLRPPNVPFSITLNTGQIYQVQANGDLSGSSIRTTSGQKIAVFSGAQQANVGVCQNPSADNQLYEQALPVDDWTALYYFVPFLGQGGDLVKIMAKSDDTNVFFDCDFEVNLNAGESYTTKVSNPTVITSTRPISMTQINESQSCNLSGIGDPSMLTHRPTNFQTRRAQWRATSSTVGSQAVLTRHFSNLIVKTTEIGNIQLDENALNASSFRPFPADPSVSYLQLEVAAGDYTITSDDPFHIYHYGFGKFDAYTLTGNYELNYDLAFNCLEIEVEGVFCVDSVLQFSAQTTTAIASYDWRVSDGQSSTDAQPNFSFNRADTYQIQLTVTTENGEVFTENYNFEVFNCPDAVCDITPTIDLTLSDECSGAPIDFSFRSTANFQSIQWLFGDGNTSNQLTPTYTYGTPGEYLLTFIGQDAFNCSFTFDTLITIKNCFGCGNPVLALDFNGDLCVGQPIEFVSDYRGINDDFTFIDWQVSGGSDSPLGMEPTTILTFNEPGNYTIQVNILELLEGCTYTGTLDFTIAECDINCLDLPQIRIDLETEVCKDSVTAISISGAANLTNIQWFINGQLQPNTTESFEFVFDGVAISTIEVVAQDVNGCDYGVGVDVSVVACGVDCSTFLLDDATVEGVLCPDSTLRFSINDLGPTTAYEWSLSTGDNFTGPTFDYIFPEDGFFSGTVTATDQRGCVAERTFEIIIESCQTLDDCLFPPDIIDIEVLSAPTLCVGDSAQLTFSTPLAVDSFHWTTSDGRTFTDTLITIPIRNSNPLVINLAVTDTKGCLFENSITIDLADDCDSTNLCQLYVPNVFSPNDDNLNDTFKPLSGCVPDFYQLQLFDRWGNLVFETTDWERAWDGTFRDKRVQNGVFPWRVIYQFAGQSLVQEVGTVTLVR